MPDSYCVQCTVRVVLVTTVDSGQSTPYGYRERGGNKDKDQEAYSDHREDIPVMDTYAALNSRLLGID